MPKSLHKDVVFRKGENYCLNVGESTFGEKSSGF